jgi:hypothetical protein
MYFTKMLNINNNNNTCSIICASILFMYLVESIIAET